MIALNKPNLRGQNDAERIEELRRYLFSLVDDLQFALQSLESGIASAKSTAIATADYNLATPDAVAYDGMAYEGEMPAIEIIEETTEEVVEEETEEVIMEESEGNKNEL